MRRSSSLAVLVGVVLAIQACSSSATPTSPPASAGAASDAPSAGASMAAEPAVVTILEQQGPRRDVLNQIIPMFNAEMAAEGKNITAELVGQTVNDEELYQQNIVLGYQGDNPPDITSYRDSSVPGFATAGYLLDLTSRVEAWPDWAHFYPILRERAKQPDGKIWTVPRHGTVMELFYRKDVLEANGISTAQPNSWQELIDRMTQLHAKTGLPAITVPAGTTWGGGTFDEGFILVFLGTGGQLYDELSGKWVVKSQALTDTFNFYATLQKGDLLPTKGLLDPNPWEPTKSDGFTGTTADGKSIPVAPPVTTQGSWGWVFDWGPNGARPIPGLYDGNVVGTWSIPSQAANQNFVWATEDWMWAIAAKSKHPDAAWEFLKFINTGKALAMDVAAVGNLAPRDDIQNVAPYSDMPYLTAMEALLPTGKSFLPQVGIDRIQKAVGDATEQILLNKMDGNQAAEFFANEATDLLGADAVESQ